MRYVFYVISAITLGGCFAFMPEALGGQAPNEVGDQAVTTASGWLTALFGPAGAMGGLGLTTVWGVLKTLKANGQRNKIVASIDEAFELADDKSVKSVKSALSAKMDPDLKDLVKKIKTNL